MRPDRARRYRLITLICESFNRYDLGDMKQAFVRRGLSVFENFTIFPSGNSGTSFVCMDTESDWDTNAAGVNPFNPKFRSLVPGFERREIWLSHCVKTKLISVGWPENWNPSCLDPGHVPQDFGLMDGSRKEPAIPTYRRLLDFLGNEFYASDYQRLIYWSVIGHYKFRVGGENKGIPHNLRKTFEAFVHLMLEDIFPLINFDTTMVLIHPDHGTSRRNRPNHIAVNDAFLLTWHPERAFSWNLERDIEWRDYRKTLQTLFGVEHRFMQNSGHSLWAPEN